MSDLVFYQPDVLPTIAALTGATPPEGIDGMSIAPTLLGSGDQAQHDFLYWEFGSQLAVRMGDWKGVLSRKKGSWDEVLANGTGTWSLFDLSKDVSEERDLAAEHPERIAAMAAVAAREFTPARPGSYRDPARTRHEKDRDAKWGTSPDRPAPRRPKGQLHRLEGADLLPASEVSIVSFSSQNEANGKLAARAVDGDPATLWHTRFSDILARHPHEIVLDLGEVRAVTGRATSRVRTAAGTSLGETGVSLLRPRAIPGRASGRHLRARPQGPDPKLPRRSGLATRASDPLGVNGKPGPRPPRSASPGYALSVRQRAACGSREAHAVDRGADRVGLASTRAPSVSSEAR